MRKIALIMMMSLGLFSLANNAIGSEITPISETQFEKLEDLQMANLDPCEYQVSRRGCQKLGPIYGCFWSGGRARCAGGEHLPFNPCKFQVAKRGCRKLGSVHGCYWTSQSGFCSSGR